MEEKLFYNEYYDFVFPIMNPEDIDIDTTDMDLPFDEYGVEL